MTDVLVTLDGDGQHNSADIPKLKTPIEKDKADVVFGYRDWKKVPVKHRLANQLMTGLFNFLFKSDVKDLTFGFNSYNRKAVKLILKEIDKDVPDGYEIDAMIKCAVIKNNLTYVQRLVRVKYFYKSGNIRGFRMVATIMLHMFRKRFVR